MFCNYCGASNPNDAAFCSACGRAVPASTVPDKTPSTIATPAAAEESVPTAPEAKSRDSQGFAATYARMTDNELFHLAKDMTSLTETARGALSLEIQKRRLGGQQFSDEAKPRLIGVGGWLVLFILGLTVFSPMATFFNLVKEYDQLNPLSETYPVELGLVILDCFISVGLMGFSIYAGISLLKIRANAVRLAKIYLIASIIYRLLILDLILGLVVLGSIGAPATQTEKVSDEIVLVLRSLLPVVIWYSYLLKSKRVAATYGTPAK